MSEPVFVITPIGGTDTFERRRSDDLFDLVIHPVIAALNESDHDLRPVRADKVERPGSITDAIVENILSSKVVIVDLSGLNPNVLYEMGIADSFGIPTVRLSDDPGSLPFDTKDHNAIELVSTDDGSLLARTVEVCKAALKAQLTHALADDFTPTSIVVRHAQSAQLASLASDLTGGDEHGKALAAVLEKLASIEARLDRPQHPDPPAPSSADAELAAGMLKYLADSGGTTPAATWDLARDVSAEFDRAAKVLEDTGLVERLAGVAGPIIRLRSNVAKAMADAPRSQATAAAERSANVVRLLLTHLHE